MFRFGFGKWLHGPSYNFSLPRKPRWTAAALGSAVVLGIGSTLPIVYAHASSSVDPESLKHEKSILHWSPPPRSELIASLKASAAKDDPFDILIIGGGATGTGCALEAASRGLRVACIERDDFSSGTSSRSTKLVHGGVRYLEKAIKELDYEQYKLVREALAERAVFLKIAPYLTYHLPIMLPVYNVSMHSHRWYQVPYYWIGSKAYDLLAGSEGLESSFFLSKSKALDAFPMLRKESLVGAMVYYDGQHNDSRMNIALALTSIYHGAKTVNHLEVVGLLKRKMSLPVHHYLRKISGVDAEEREVLYGATVRDTMTNETFDVHAKSIVNATGPFCDSIRRMDNPGMEAMVAPSAGVHIVLPSYYSPRHMGLVDPKTSDGRVIFFLPWEGNTIAGTTDSPATLTYDPVPPEKDIQFIMDEVSNYLDDEIQVRRSDVLAAWSGIRPLVKDPEARNTASLVRSHIVTLSSSGLLTIAGGKWTTYRNMAEEAIDKAIEVFALAPTGPSISKKLPLIGSHGYKKTSYLKLIQQYGFDTEVAQHLVSSYGDRAFIVASLSDLNDCRWPVQGRRLASWYPYIESEVKYAVRSEYALTAVDVLARRTRLAFLSAHSALEALPKVVRIMSAELAWSPARQASEFATAKKFLKTMGLDLDIPSQARFTKEHLAEFRLAFDSLDRKRVGLLTKNDLPSLLSRLAAAGVPFEPAKLDLAIEKAGLGFSGEEDATVDFSVFLDIMMELSPQARALDTKSRDEEAKIPTERSGGGV